MNHELTTVINALSEKKAHDIVAYEYQPLNPYIDYMVIASAGSVRQAAALAENVIDRAHEAGIAVRSKEGDKESPWILVDLHTLIVHIFLDEERSVYRLEQLYADLVSVDITC